jgi:hypothetical protein
LRCFRLLVEHESVKAKSRPILVGASVDIAYTRRGTKTQSGAEARHSANRYRNSMRAPCDSKLESGRLLGLRRQTSGQNSREADELLGAFHASVRHCARRV